jgi:hypothetical protein
MSANFSLMPGTSMTPEITLPRNRKTLYTILVDVEFLNDGQREQQQQKHADEPQQHAA